MSYSLRWCRTRGAGEEGEAGHAVTAIPAALKAVDRGNDRAGQGIQAGELAAHDGVTHRQHAAQLATANGERRLLTREGDR